MNNDTNPVSGPAPSSDDDATEAKDEEIAHLTNQDRLPQDYETPAASADDPYLRDLPPGHPETDSNIDQTEAYNEGTTGATNVWAQHESNDRKDDALFGPD